MNVRAKFVVDEITRSRYSASSGVVKVRLSAVTPEGVPENQRFHRYTPSGSIEMSIDNPSAAEAFELGKAFYVDFSPAE